MLFVFFVLEGFYLIKFDQLSELINTPNFKLTGSVCNASFRYKITKLGGGGLKKEIATEKNHTYMFFVLFCVRRIVRAVLNHRKLFTSIKSGSYFASRREEQKRSSMYFCKVLSSEYNHSQNPSFVAGDNAALVNSSFIREPNTYITSVGLYNDNNELLAVAKLSRPFKKDPNTEALIKVRLDF